MNTTVLGFEINGGEPVHVAHEGHVHSVNLAGQQSVVRHVCVTFSGPVTLAPDAATIAPKPVTVISGVQPNQLPVVTSVSPVLGSNGVKWLVRFGGPGAHASSGRIRDGVYTLTIDASKVEGVSGPLPGNATFDFAALYAAKLIPAPSLIVTAEQVAAVQATFGQSLDGSEFDPAKDTNLDGYIDPADLFAASDVAGTEWRL